MKALVVLYDLFSMQEISCLTEILACTGNTIQTCSRSMDSVMTEDGFQVVPDMTLDEVNFDDYNCVILPGIAYMFHVLKQKEYAEFLS